MGTMNKVVLIGRLGRRPELRFTADGTPVCNLSVATNHSYLDREGQRQQRTIWHKIVAWGKQAESCCQYLDKGRLVCVEGRLDNQSYTDREGIQRWRTEVISNAVVFLDSASDRPSFGPPDPSNEHSLGVRSTGEGNGIDEAKDSIEELPF